MINKYIKATLLAMISVGNMQAQIARPIPKLVVNIAIDQLRTDYIETFLPYYGEKGFRKLFYGGAVYDNAQYSFSPVDEASALATIVTGTSPYYHGISGTMWLDKNTLVPISCVDDNSCEGLFTKDASSPQSLTATTVNDELKMSTDGKAFVYSVALNREAAVLGGGHAADGAFWINKSSKCWCTSNYYGKREPNWMTDYNLSTEVNVEKDNGNANVTDMALLCLSSVNMGQDDVPDMLTVTYDAKPLSKDKDGKKLQSLYMQLDHELGKLISTVEEKVGKNNVLFVVTGTGYTTDTDEKFKKYHIPTGTFYINRTANLLNMYLSAIYGQNKYVEGYFYNQIFLNIKQIELKRISMSDILSRSQSFLIQNAGVRNVFTSKNLLFSGEAGNAKMHNWYNPSRCGDIIVEVAPGWKLFNEENKQQYISRETLSSFPIVLYGTGIMAKQVSTPVAVERIAPTIAKAIRIRAPNACATAPLY